jgi:hypothetical protein
VFDERYREYIIPTEDDALIRFPIEMGSGVILITRHVDETLSIRLPPHCPGIEVKIRGEDGSQLDPEIFYTRKIFASTARTRRPWSAPRAALARQT